MDHAVILACTVNAVALIVQVGSFYVWKGQVTERLDRVRRDLDDLEDDLRQGGCPAFGTAGRRIESGS